MAIVNTAHCHIITYFIIIQDSYNILVCVKMPVGAGQGGQCAPQRGTPALSEQQQRMAVQPVSADQDSSVPTKPVADVGAF